MTTLELDGNAKVERQLNPMPLSTYWSYVIQIMQAVISQAKKLGKTVYLFSVDSEGNKVVHMNFVSPDLRSKGLDARTWATKIADVLGGKVSQT